MSTVSRLTPSQTLNLSSHVHSLQGDPSQTLHLGPHVHSLQADPSQTLYLGSHVHSLHSLHKTETDSQTEQING